MSVSIGPDQPYSWVIAVAAWAVNVFVSGISKANGDFYVALIDVYGTTRMEANLPFTLRNSIRNIAGPVVGVLGHRYSVRTITIIGGVLAAGGIMLCSVAPNITWISIFWGGFHGLGVAFANTLFLTTINQHFVKHRATALGIALSGFSVGSFFFPMILELLLDTYGLQGAFLLTGGLVMQMFPASILLTEPNWLHSRPEEYTCRNNVKVSGTIHKLKNPRKNPSLTKNSLMNIFNADEKSSPETSPSNNYLYLDKNISKYCSVYCTAISVESSSYIISSQDISNVKNQGPFLHDIFLSCKQSQTISAEKVSIKVQAQKEQGQVQNSSVLKALINVYKNPMFHMISISFGTYLLIYDSLMTVIVDYTKDKGLDEAKSKYFISSLALGDFIGRLCFGWITDKNYIGVEKFILILQVIQGIYIVLLPLLHSFEALISLIVLQGVTGGIVSVMIAVLVAKYLPLEQSMAFGGNSLFAGIISFGIPPIIGHFRDVEGSYDGMFYIIGGSSILSGLLWIFEPVFVRLIKDKEQNSLET